LASANFKHTSPQNTKTNTLEREKGEKKQKTQKLSTIDTCKIPFWGFLML
jgi:hypothetical protein